MASIFTDALVPQVASKAVGTSAVRISTVTQLVIAMTIEANSANTGILFVGDASVSATNCLHLSAGDSYSPPVVYAGGTNAREYDLSEWYLRGSAANLKATILKIRKAIQV